MSFVSENIDDRNGQATANDQAPPSVDRTPAAPNYSNLPITPAQLDDLKKSGLSPDIIRRAGLSTILQKERIGQILKWDNYDGSLGPCLAFPYHDCDGKPLPNYIRLKPSKPRGDKKNGGKVCKYESPKGSKNHPYIVPGTGEALKNPEEPLILDEGEKKTLAGVQDGLLCVGLPGVWNWCKKRAKEEKVFELIAGLASIPWQGRTVLICFDSDAAENQKVRVAEWHLAKTLQRHGATVKIIRLPAGAPGPDGKPGKVGLDDYLVAHGAAAFRELMATATEPEPPDHASDVPNEAPDDPHRLARLYIEQKCQHADGLKLRAYRQEWHRWHGTAWAPQPEAELRAELTELAKAEMDKANLRDLEAADPEKPPPTVRKVTSRMISDFAHALQSLTILPGDIDQPAWLNGEGSFSAHEILACKNGLVHLPSLVAGKQNFTAPTPRFFSPTALSFDFSLDAPRPSAWWDFLAKLWPNDPASIETLQEWFGYCLTPDTSQQKILMLLGPKRSGKGTIARIMRALIGRANVSGPSLSSLCTNFGLWTLLGKTVAIISDARLSGRTDAAIVTERLLAISGEDAVDIDRKFLPTVTTKLLTRFMILTNELPRLADSSGALPGRMVVLRLTESWFGREDTKLTGRLLRELPAILLWAVAGWERLRTRGYFLQPDAGKSLANDLEDLSSPIGAFIRDRCKVGSECEIEKALLYQGWKSWCIEQGKDKPGDAGIFGRNLRAARPAIGESHPSVEGRGRVWFYKGITLAD